VRTAASKPAAAMNRTNSPGSVPPEIWAESFARIFYRNGINLGLPLVVCPGLHGLFEDGDRAELDPSQVKHLMPFGGYKGYGIGMATDLLSATLSGACDSRHMGSFWKPGDGEIQGTGFFLGVINPGAITDPVEFEKRVAAYIDEIKNAEKADGVEEIFVAGEIEQRKYEKARKEGVVLSEVVENELKSIGEETGVPFPFD